MLHQNFTITNDGIHTTAIRRIDQIGDKVEIGRKGRLTQIDQTKIGPLALLNLTRFQSEQRSANFCSRGEHLPTRQRFRILSPHLA